MIKKLSKLFSLVFSVLFLLTVIYIPVSALNENEAVFSLSGASGVKKGDTVVVEISVNSGSGTKINGMDFSLLFESEYISYINGSAKLNVNTDNSPTVSVLNNRLNLAWDSGTSVPLASGKFASFSFKVENISKELEIKLNFGSCYAIKIVSGRVVYTDIATSVTNTAMIKGENEDAAVNAVIAAIDGIGEVTADSKSQLNLIYNAYKKLSQAQKQKVTNYDKLAEAIRKCDELIKQEENDPVTNEIKDYKIKYSEALNLRVSTVGPNDVGKRTEALEAMKKLSSHAQVELLRTKYLLDSVLVKAKELKSEEDRKSNEEKLRAEAAALANEYRNGIYKWVFALTTDTVRIVDGEGVNLAYEELMNIEIINDIAFKLLAPEKELLESLKKRIDELKLIQNPKLSAAIAKANDFREKFGFLFTLKDDEVTYDEKIDIYIAYELLNSYDDDVKELLSSELERLEQLMSIVGDLEPDEVKEVENVVNEITKIKIVHDTQGLENLKVDLNSRKMSLTAYILMGLCALSAILLGVLRYAYYKLRKRYYPEQFMKGGI